MGTFKAGAGKQEIHIPEAYLKVENFHTIHDAIHARALLLKTEKESFLILSLELTSLSEQEVQSIKELIFKETQIQMERIWVCATHSFSSPHLFSDSMLQTQEKITEKRLYRQNIHNACLKAVRTAQKNLREAAMGTGKETCEIVANRDIELEDGWWVGTKGNGPSDPTVTVLSFQDNTGKTIALLSHFAMQSSVMDQSELLSGGKAVTSDIAGNACSYVENVLDNGGICLFLIGAAGDQAPVEKAVNERFENGKRFRTDLHEQGFEICQRLAKKLGSAIFTGREKNNQPPNPGTAPKLESYHLCSRKANGKRYPFPGTHT